MALHAKILKFCCKKIRQAKVKVIKEQGFSIYARCFDLFKAGQRVRWVYTCFSLFVPIILKLALGLHIRL